MDWVDGYPWYLELDSLSVRRVRLLESDLERQVKLNLGQPDYRGCEFLRALEARYV